MGYFAYAAGGTEIVLGAIEQTVAGFDTQVQIAIFVDVLLGSACSPAISVYSITVHF